MKFLQKRMRKWLGRPVRSSASKQWVVGKSSIFVGRFSYGHESVVIEQWGEGATLSFGAFCSIAKDVTVMLGGNHRADWATTFPFGQIFEPELGGGEIEGHPSTKGDVIVGNDVWIGRGAVILSGVEICSGAVIATNSVVTKNVGAYEVWGGNPARFIRSRFSEQIIDQFLALNWWDLEVEKIREIAPLLSQPPNETIMRAIQQIADR